MIVIVIHRLTRHFSPVIDAIADVTNEGHVPLSSLLIGRHWRARDRPQTTPPAVQRRASGKDFVAKLHRRYRLPPSRRGCPGCNGVSNNEARGKGAAVSGLQAARSTDKKLYLTRAFGESVSLTSPKGGKNTLKHFAR